MNPVGLGEDPEILAHLKRLAAQGRIVPEDEPAAPREPTCQDCQDRGWLGEPPDRRRCACHQGADLARCSTPPRYQRYTRASWEKTFQPWLQQPLLAPLATWPTEEPGDWLVLLWGLQGRRKTSLATALLGDAVARTGRKGLWMDQTDWIDTMEAAMAPGASPTAAELYVRARDADILLLDDLGAVRGGRAGRRADQDWWTERVAALLRHREAWLKPTICTTNGEPKDLGRLDPSLVGRCAVRLSIEAKGRDYREVIR